jgi:hypothetical protein
MVRRETLIQVAVLALSVAFAATCVAVFMTRGNACCIRAKLRIGAMLLNLNGLVAAAAGCPFIATCYEAVVQDDIEITDPEPAYASGDFEITVDLRERTDLQGVISGRVSDQFSYRLCKRPAPVAVDNGDAADPTVNACADAARIVAQDDLAAADGALDEPTEEFAIALDPALATGDYTLELHRAAAADVAIGDLTYPSYRVIVLGGTDPLAK